MGMVKTITVVAVGCLLGAGSAAAAQPGSASAQGGPLCIRHTNSGGYGDLCRTWKYKDGSYSGYMEVTIHDTANDRHGVAAQVTFGGGGMKTVAETTKGPGDSAHVRFPYGNAANTYMRLCLFNGKGFSNCTAWR